MLKNTEAIILLYVENTEAIICSILFSHKFSDRSIYFPTDFTIVPMAAI